MSESKPSEVPLTKKPYKSPRIVSYGNIRDITRDVGKKGPKDSYPPTKPSGVKNTAM